MITGGSLPPCGELGKPPPSQKRSVKSCEWEGHELGQLREEEKR